MNEGKKDDRKYTVFAVLAAVMLTLVFAGGVVVFAWAIHEEAINRAPFYTQLMTIGAVLAISATFTASLMSMLRRNGSER